MRESWIGKDEKTIRNDIVSIAKKETGLTNFKSTGVLRGIVEVIVAVVFFIYKTAINPVYSNATLDSATGIFLSFWGLLLGVVRKQNGKAAGNFTGHSYGEGQIPEGAWIVVKGTELRYRVTAKTAFGADSAFQIPVAAEFAGADYNIGSGMPVLITRVIPGLGQDSVSVGEDWITTPGQDAEPDDSYRARIKDRWRSQILGDTKEVYRFYAEEVDGVRSARIIRTPRGPGSADVIIAAANGLPNEKLIDAVKANLYGHELMAFDVQVKAPEVNTVTVRIEYSGEAPEGEVALIAEHYVYDLGIGGRFKKNDLYDLYKPLNLKTIEIVSPDRDVQPDGWVIIVATVEVVKGS